MKRIMATGWANVDMRSIFTSFWGHGNSRIDILLLGILIIMIQGCSVNSATSQNMDFISVPESNNSLFNTQNIDVPSIERLTHLSQIQMAELHSFIQRESISTLLPRQQVFAFVSAKMVNFNYEGKNYLASEAFDRRAGNCMTLALLTYAVAKALNVDIRFQVIHAAPMLVDMTNEFAVSSDHVRAFLYNEPTVGHYLGATSYSIIDYFPNSYDRGGAIVSEQEFVAMFYRNLAADALLNGDLNLSYAMLNTGLSLSPRYTPLINMMAIVHRRAGDEAAAREFYEYGLSVAQNQLVLLSNYRYLLEQQGDMAGVKKVEEKLLSLDDPTPYEWYSLGKEALSEKEFSKAVVYLNKFLRNTPYFHNAYYELAKAQYGLGKIGKAKASLRKAIELASLSENQKKYQAKLYWLNLGMQE